MRSLIIPILIALGFVAAIAILGCIFSPENAVSILGFCGFITVSLLSLLAQCYTADRLEQNAAKLEKNANEVKIDVAEVKVDLKKSNEVSLEKLASIEKTGVATHTLVNSQYGEALRIAMDLSEFKWLTTQNPADRKASEMARSKYEEHMKKQAILDKQDAAAEAAAA